jgi:ketosteroid isomerase-like protein
MTTKPFLTLIVAATCVTIASCSRVPSVDTRAEADTIRDIERQWSDAMNAKDIDKILSLCGPDFSEMPANGPILVGQQAMRKSLDEFLTGAKISWANVPEFVEVAASGDLGYVRGIYRFSQEIPEGHIEDVGKYVAIHKKIDGKWKVVVDIWNSDRPVSSQ